MNFFQISGVILGVIGIGILIGLLIQGTKILFVINKIEDIVMGGRE